MPRHAAPAALLATLAAAPPAFAHAILMSSAPPVQGQVAAGPETVTLRYNSRVDHARSSLVLTRPDGSTSRLPIATGSPTDVLQTSVSLPPGDYTLRWQVLATDGHITRGDVPFTVAAGAASPPGSPQAATPAHPAAGH